MERYGETKKNKVRKRDATRKLKLIDAKYIKKRGRRKWRGDSKRIKIKIDEERSREVAGVKGERCIKMDGKY